jgi:uncharacterized membrane protein
MIPPTDWELKKFLAIVAAIQLVILGLVGLAHLGYDIPVLRQIIGFTYLTFVPGILILRILKIHNPGIARTVLYSVGLSIAFVMFSGLFLNFLLPYLGISNPISVLPLTIELAIFTIVLCFVAYIRDRDFQHPETPHIKTKQTYASPSLFLFLLPILAALGALLVAYRENNTLLLILLPIIAFIPVLVAFDKFIPVKIYGLAIVAISLSLLYHQTLVSPYLIGWDIHVEYYFQNLIVTNSYWDSSIPYSLNSMLSITMLCPIYSLVSGMDGIWVFKIIYPFIFSLVPLGLFQIWQEQIGAKKAFLATFFFMSMLVFFTEMTALARQQIAELFFVLLILLMVDTKLNLPHRMLQRSILAVIFIISIAVSHYALAWICIAFFVLDWLLLLPMRGKRVGSWWRNRFGVSSASPGAATSISEAKLIPSVLSGTLVCLYVVFLLSWYMYTSSGAPFNKIVYIGETSYGTLFEFFNPAARELLVLTAVGLGQTSVTTLGWVFRVVQYATQFLIFVGLVKLIVRPQELKLKAEYIGLTLVSILILLMCIVLPYFSSYLGVARFYHIALILLSPFCIIGGEVLWQSAVKAVKRVSIWLRIGRERLSSIRRNSAFGTLSFAHVLLVLMILIPYFLFNTGFIFEITKHRYIPGNFPISMPLSKYRLDGAYYNWQEGAGVEWLSNAIDDKSKVYADAYGQLILRDKLYGRVKMFPSDIQGMPHDTYIYLRSWNVERNEILVKIRQEAQVRPEHVNLNDAPELYRLINSKGLLYNNGGAKILAP